MPAKVFFLPWSRIKDFDNWIKYTGLFETFKERRFTAIKIHFGEEGNHGFIKPEYVKPVAAGISARGAHPFMTDANTIYVGTRADAVHHALTADKHGFNIANCGCPVIIADGLRGNAGVDVPVNLKHFKKVSISNAVHYSDSLALMSHFKGHEITGFGGAIKNAGMGAATRAGKYAMHDRLFPRVDVEKCEACANCVKWCPQKALTLKNKKIVMNQTKCVGCGECTLSCKFGVFHIPWDETTGAAQEKIVEYAYGVVKDKPLICINFVNYVTKFCDCYPTKGEPLIKDVGIFAGTDPVAVDQACADAVNKEFGSDFVKHIFPGIEWRQQFEYAEKLGLGTRSYEILK